VTENHNVKIRKAVSADAQALAEARYAFRAELNTPVVDRDAFVSRCAAWMTKNLDSQDWHCWVADRDGELLGNVWLEIVEKMPNPAGEPEINGYITNFSIVPAERGREIGSALLTCATEWARERGIYSLFLWPTTRSVAFYERNGFEFGRVLENNLHGTRFNG
jgi:ribosomal protein S18 acetylase RimI-like enzyme